MVSIFAHCKQSKTGVGECLGLMLHFCPPQSTYCHSVNNSKNINWSSAFIKQLYVSHLQNTTYTITSIRYSNKKSTFGNCADQNATFSFILCSTYLPPLSNTHPLLSWSIHAGQRWKLCDHGRVQYTYATPVTITWWADTWHWMLSGIITYNNWLETQEGYAFLTISKYNMVIWTG